MSLCDATLHNWQDYVHNNLHHQSLGTSLFQALYGRRCRVPIDWNNSVKHWVVIWQPRFYVDKRRTYREFPLGDHFYLQVKPRKRKSALHQRGCAKLAPSIVVLFKYWKRLEMQHTSSHYQPISPFKIYSMSHC